MPGCEPDKRGGGAVGPAAAAAARRVVRAGGRAPRQCRVRAAGRLGARQPRLRAGSGARAAAAGPAAATAQVTTSLLALRLYSHVIAQFIRQIHPTTPSPTCCVQDFTNFMLKIYFVND